MSYFRETFKDILSEEQLKIIHEGREEEYIFPLIQLGYLHKDFENKTGGDQLILRNALKVFRREYQECQLIKEELYFDDLNDYNLQFYEPSPVEIKLLHQLSSLDGSFIVNSKALNQYKLFSRVHSYRLSLLGLKNVTLENSNHNLKSFFKIEDDNQIYNLVGNIPSCIQHLLKNEIQVSSLSFSKSQEDTDHKELSISRKIIQLLLWIYGYYDGRIDSILASQTFKSIHKVLEQENENPKLYFFDSNDTLLLNTRKFLSLFNARIIKEKSEMGAVAKLIDQFLEKDKKREEGNRLINNAWENEIEHRKENYDKGRPTYFGTTTIVQSVRRQFRSFYKKAKKVASQTINFMKQLFKTIHSAVQLFYREIREGLKVFQQGINFLFGKKEIMTHFIDNKVAYSYLDKDFDMQNYYSNQCGSKNIIRHYRHCQRHINALKYSLKVCGNILPWVLRYKNPITWTRLSFQIAIEVRNVFNDYLYQKAKEVILDRSTP